MPLRLLVVGTGFGKTYLEAAKANPSHWEIAGLVARTAGSLAETSPRFNIPEECQFTDLDTALDTLPDIDAVVIAVPNEQHHALAAKVLDRGLNLAIEKPITDTWDEAADLVHRLDAHPSVKAMVGQTLRGEIPIRMMDYHLRDGKIGRIDQILFECHWNWVVSHPESDKNWRFRLPDMYLDDIGVHNIDEIRMLSGNKKALSVVCQTWTPPSFPIKEITAASASATITLEDDIHVSYFGSMASKGHDVGWYGRIHLFGDKGCMFREASGQPYLYLGDSTTPIGLDDAYGDDVDEYLPMIEFDKIPYLLEDFYQAIKDDRPPITDLHDNLNTHAIIQAMKLSVREDRLVDVQSEFPMP